jgi:hypothetical protein
MKTFKDLEFKDHFIPGAVQSYFEFDNGKFISVVGGKKGCGLYGDGINTFEIMDSITEKEDSSVIGWLSKIEITERMLELQK